MTKNIVVHVANIDISQESGMGRVAWHWREAFQKRGYEFAHIGRAEVGKLLHYSLFPAAAYRYYKKHFEQQASLILVHEPASGSFINQNVPVVVFSHGLERRGWELGRRRKNENSEKVRLRTKLLNALLLKRSAVGLRKADKVLLINSEDSAYARENYNRKNGDSFVFKNGVDLSELTAEDQPSDELNVLFLGTWLERKGIYTLLESARILVEKAINVHWTLAGVGVAEDIVTSAWSERRRGDVTVIPQFLSDQESALLMNANIFVLPSYFEGQPLALLQAMEAGRCCITTNCCGQRDLIEHEYNGLLFEAGDAKALADLIERCAKDRELRLRLGRNAKRSVQNRQWATVAAEVVDQVEQVVPRAQQVKGF